MVEFLKTWFGSRRSSGLTAAPSQAPQWSAQNATDLRKFLSSETGQTLMARARGLECATALKACQNQEQIHPQRAAGVSDTLNWIVSLSTISGASPVQDANEEFESRSMAEAEYPLTQPA